MFGDCLECLIKVGWLFFREVFKNLMKYFDCLIIVYIVLMCDNLKYEYGYKGNKVWYYIGRFERGMKV